MKLRPVFEEEGPRKLPSTAGKCTGNQESQRFFTSKHGSKMK
jgi:hypothetical protein